MKEAPLKITTRKIKDIKPNPDNPRVIKDDKFKKLVKSITDFPKMLEIRPVVLDENDVILGGNMRYRAAIDAGLKELPTIQVEDLSEEQKKEFIIKDNVGFGEWDWEMLANSFDEIQLEEWGLDVPIFDTEPSMDELIGEQRNKPATMKITFESPEQLQKAEIDIQELIDRKYKGAFFSVSAGEI